MSIVGIGSAGGFLTEAQVDARVVAVASGKRSRWIGIEECQNGASQIPAALAYIWTFSNANIPARLFDPTSVEFVLKNFAIPPNFDVARGIAFQPYWAPTDTGTNPVVWGIRANSIADLEAVGGHASDSLLSIDAGGGVVDSVQIGPESTEQFVGTFSKGNLASIRIERIANSGSDTYTVDANLIGIMLFYWVDDPAEA